MSKNALSSVVNTTTTRPDIVAATMVAPDATLSELILTGDDSERFATIRRLIGGELTRLTIDDHDGPAAIGWVDALAARRGLPVNEVGSVLADRVVIGPIVITGAGRGDSESITSIHGGLLSVIEQLSREHLTH